MNVLWICTDQQRFDSLKCYGNPVIDTPNLDALAAEGILFENCYSQSPVCSPSRAGFLTGRYPQVCNMYENGASISPHEILVTKVLADAGHTCGLSGKLHLSVCNPSITKDMEPRIDDGYSAFYWSHHPDKHWPLNDYHVWLGERGETYRKQKLSGTCDISYGMPQALHHTTYCTDRAKQFMKTHQGFDNPWLFSVNYFDPHHPFDPPRDLLEKYLAKLDEIAPPNYVPGELDEKPLYQRIDHEGAYGGNVGLIYDNMDEREHKMHTAAYYAMVELVDTQVGELVACLKQSGQYEDTLIIFTSDHGEMLGDHGLYLKGPFFYDCAVKVPLIIHCPKKLKKGLRVPALVELIDLPQTILEACEVAAPPTMMGKSLWQMCTGDAPTKCHKEYVTCEYFNAMPWHKDPPARCVMLYDGRYKLVFVSSTGEGELYDLYADPTETHNRWMDSALMDEKNRLLLALTKKLLDMRDPSYTRCAEW